MFSHCNVVEHRRLTISGALASPVAGNTGKVKLSEGSRSSSRHAEVIAKELTWYGGVHPETRESDTTLIHYEREALTDGPFSDMLITDFRRH